MSFNIKQPSCAANPCPGWWVQDKKPRKFAHLKKSCTVANMEPTADIATLMRQMLTDNAAAAGNVVAVARAERETAAAEREAARQALLEVKQNAEAISATFYHKHLAHLEADTQERLLREYADRLLWYGLPPGEVAALLDAPDQMVEEIARRVGYTRVTVDDSDATSHAKVGYENHGRGGYMRLTWGEYQCRFWFEIAARPALLLIEIPTEDKWTAETGIPVEQRPQVLQYLGERMVADQMPSHRFRIEYAAVVIY